MSLPFSGESEFEWDCERKSGCWKNECSKINYVGTGYNGGKNKDVLNF